MPKSLLAMALVYSVNGFAAEPSKTESYQDFQAEQAENSIPEKPLKTASGTVEDIVSTKEYSFVAVKTDKDTMWLATTKTELQKGEKVVFKYGEAVKNFNSKALQRTFPAIYFVGSVDKQSELAKVGPDSMLAVVMKERSNLAGSQVTVSGRVTKVNRKILGKNWIHISDKSLQGTGKDIAISSEEDVRVGQKISAEGVLAADKDFGSGYFFAVLIEDAKITVRK